MAWFAVSLILPVWAAYVLWPTATARLATARPRGSFAFAWRPASESGISSCTYFLWLFFIGAPGKNYHICELATFAAVGLFGWVLLEFSLSLWERGRG